MNTTALRQALSELNAAYEQSRTRQARLQSELQQEVIENQRLLIGRDALRQILGDELRGAEDQAQACAEGHKRPDTALPASSATPPAAAE